MAYLSISNSITFSDSIFEFTRIPKYDFSLFSLKNTYTTASGKTVTYPIKSQKARISFTAEIQGDYLEDNIQKGEYSALMTILKQNSEFYCKYKRPSETSLAVGKFNLTSDISVVKILSANGLNGGLYAVSMTFEEV